MNCLVSKIIIYFPILWRGLVKQSKFVHCSSQVCSFICSLLFQVTWNNGRRFTSPGPGPVTRSQDLANTQGIFGTEVRVLTNKRPVFGSIDLSWPIRGLLPKKPLWVKVILQVIRGHYFSSFDLSWPIRGQYQVTWPVLTNQKPVVFIHISATDKCLWLLSSLDNINIFWENYVKARISQIINSNKLSSLMLIRNTYNIQGPIQDQFWVNCNVNDNTFYNSIEIKPVNHSLWVENFSKVYSTWSS